MARLALEDLRKRFGRTTALDGISLDIADGEFFVLLGPSGAGKTTTLKTIAGLEEPDGGRVRVNGHDLAGVEPYRRNMAMAFESYALYPQRTVADNLASPLRSGRNGRVGAAEQAERIDRVTTMLGINHLLQRLPRELSNGQRQRVALGRVLIRPADVYLLDEPLSHLDAKLRASMRAELKALRDSSGAGVSSTTTVYVTHDYQEALALGDRIGVLRNGKLVQVGTAEELWTRPVDTFVATALGQPEMNLVPGTVASGRFTVPDRAFDLLAPGIADAEVLLGFRPRDAVVGGSEPPARAASGALPVRGIAELIEPLGRLSEISVQIGQTNVAVVATAAERSGVRESDPVTVWLPPDGLHYFDASGPGVRLEVAA